MRARWLAPGDEPAVWNLLISEPGFNLPALHLLERQGLAGPVRFVLVEGPGGLPLWGAAGIDGRWLLFGGPNVRSEPSLAASQVAPLLTASGLLLLEGEARLVLRLGRHLTMRRLHALERHAVAMAGPSPVAPIPLSSQEVRPARPGELPAIERLYRNHGEPVDPIALTEAARSGHLWIAPGPEGPRAAAMAPVRTGLAAWVGAVFTHPACRGRGLASALVTSLTHLLQSEGLAVYLLHRPGGPGHLYRRLGFTPAGNWLRARFSP